MSLDKVRVATAAITGEIYVGRIDKDGEFFTSKRLATNECLNAVIQYMMHDAPSGAAQEFSADGGRTYHRITVEPVCGTCRGTGIDGDCGPDGAAISVQCGCCQGTGKRQPSDKSVPGE